ncbi:AMP-binding protein, partial [Streptomyces evansiae]|uniref:AMP-binding protein n=1 Tax=Streptomyces evansiae TaxID=3075535 RepID=UPI0028844FF0
MIDAERLHDALNAVARRHPILRTTYRADENGEPTATEPDYVSPHYTYREINESANRLAHWLIGQGIGTEDRVAVLLEKSPELVITALGIVKAGAVYLPVDPTYPEDRLTYILEDSDPKIVLREPVD